MVSVIMPRQGQSVESCIITKWHKKQGDAVMAGDLLFSYETDKAAFDEEAKEAGTLLSILHEAGDDVPCLEAVCIIGNPGDQIDEAARNPGADQPVQAKIVHEAKPVMSLPVDHDATGIKISPRARALAAGNGAIVSKAQPSGPHGRIIERDIQALADQGLAATRASGNGDVNFVQGTGLGGRVTLRDAKQNVAAGHAQIETQPALPIAEAWDEPLTNIRKVIAKTMHDSLSTMAQLTHNATYDATNLLALRNLFKQGGAAYGMEGVTIGDLIVFAVTRTLTKPEHAPLNAHFFDDHLHCFRNVHMGIAVDTPRGLMVPTLRNANKMTLLEISAETKKLASACQTGSIDPDLLSGASFTVSNLGALEIEHFTPVINPPQTGILGINTIGQRVRERDGQIEVYPAMTLSLTYDHRALDGAPASRFLRDVKRNLENIQMLLGGGSYNV